MLVVGDTETVLLASCSTVDVRPGVDVVVVLVVVADTVLDELLMPDTDCEPVDVFGFVTNVFCDVT